MIDEVKATKKGRRGRPKSTKESAKPTDNGGSKSHKRRRQANPAPKQQQEEPKAAAPTTQPKSVRDNADTCCTCAQGGDLVCCESCPLAFHFFCNVPPLDPDNLPEIFLCSSCKPAAMKTSHVIHPFRDAIEVALKRNPQPFQLPGRLAPSPDKPQERRLHASHRTRLCYECDKHVAYGDPTHLQCSQCDSSYHQDCLGAPLAYHPRGAPWVCPKHPEHIYKEVRRNRRFTSQRSITIPQAPLDVVPLQFVRKIRRERKKDLEKKSQSKPSTDDATQFMEGMFALHQDWWVRNQSKKTCIAKDAESTTTVLLAMEQETKTMTKKQMADALHVLRGVLRPILAKEGARRKRNDRGAADDSSVPNAMNKEEEDGIPASTSRTLAALRCTSTGDKWSMKSSVFIFGCGAKCDLNLANMGPMCDVLESHAEISFDSERKQFELITSSEDQSVYVNYEVCSKHDETAMVLEPNCVLDICGLKFVFQPAQ